MRCFQIIARFIHSRIAKGPRWVTQLYISALSTISRAIDTPALSTRVRNSLRGLKWPSIDFGGRNVIVGSGTTILLHPHLGEFDEAALFSRRLGDASETACFSCLENF